MSSIPVLPSERISVPSLSSPVRRTRVPGIVSAAPREDEAPAAGVPTVLIAEDNTDSREALSTLLASLDYHVIEAADGAEAVARARQHRPDLILIDMMMPVMDGFEAVRVLRADDRFREVPIVAITAMEGVRERVLAAGCTEMYRKPLNVRGFLEALKQWVRR